MMKIKRSFFTFLAATMAFVGLSLPATAQDDGPGVISVRITQVKSGKVSEWVELQKTLMESRRAAGAPSRDIWQVVRGPTNTFQTVSFYDNFAALDQPFNSGMEPADWARWLGRIGEVTDTSRLIMLRFHPDLGIPSGEGFEPNMMVLRYRTVGAGQGDDYQDWIEDKLVPALKEGGVTGVSFARVVAGDDTNMWVSASMIDSYSVYDEPGPFDGKSDRQIDAIMKGANEIVRDSRNEVLRYRADLSY